MFPLKGYFSGNLTTDPVDISIKVIDRLKRKAFSPVKRIEAFLRGTQQPFDLTCVAKAHGNNTINKVIDVFRQIHVVCWHSCTA